MRVLKIDLRTDSPSAGEFIRYTAIDIKREG